MMVQAMNPSNSAILLLAHGTPDVLSHMAEYLQKVTGGRPMPQHVVEELQHRYAEIGLLETPLPEGPPLTRWTLEQGKLLSDVLGQKVYVGMRNWHPYIADVVAQMKSDGVTHARVLCLAPQNSRTSTGLYKKALMAAAGDAFTLDFIAGWADEPLLAHGTPDVLGEMAEYLAKVTNGRPLPASVVEELQHRYAEIGLRDTPLPEGPPLTRWTLAQAKLLDEALDLPVYVGMRNWHPYIADVIAQMRADGITSFRALCLAPQNSRTSTGLYKRAATSAAEGMEMEFIAGWADHPLLAQAFAEKLWPVWAEACATLSAQAGKPVRVPVLFTAHSVPCRTILSSAQPQQRPGAPVPADGIQAYDPSATPDPYPVECKRTALHVAEALAPVGMTGRDWFFAFQSQGIAGAPWIGPTVEDTLKALAAEGHKGVVLQPIGFLCDHVEILYDIDIAFTQTARDLGLRLWRAQSLNDSPTLIRALADVASGQYAAEVAELVTA